ncbi:acyl-CoA dehydrogenase family protein [Aquabacterium sp.]|jgi:acyl-CoA dehydrogenase|uniref:acyl-CoA dehydrogenase family protein n=1 Tax=Aquabacterium sp. TaxID=1872578 RepID=UPI0026320391|nr:acyl-CoA dehydrogenase family protein [Aquabacterium sp.]MDD2977705.1 acyl-CoA dehydrogenase family protein [Aquabacterium sp.]
MPIQNFESTWMTDEHKMLLESATRFFKEQWGPKDEAWRAQGMMDRQAWRDAGANGFLCASMPEEYGGAGGDFGHEAALILAQAAAGQSGFGGSLHSGIVAPYILHYGTEEQKKRWLPKMASGELIGAIAMTEPGTGSDLQGVRTSAVLEGDTYKINGSKTFITNGQLANLIVVVCKTDKSKGAQGISLLMVETDEVTGFRRGRNLDKIGMDAQDTSELFFDDVVVPKDNLLGGQEGMGFFQLMQELPQERLIVAVGGVGAMELAMQETLAYTKDRQAFGKPIFNFQNTRFTLAECQALLMASRAMVDAAMVSHLKGELGVERAALLKYWITDQQCKLIDECLQLFGGYGYMKEYVIARLYADARVQRIYGGTNEIMKELASRFL